jgi:hypothetical protein
LRIFWGRSWKRKRCCSHRSSLGDSRRVPGRPANQRAMPVSTHFIFRSCPRKCVSFILCRPTCLLLYYESTSLREAEAGRSVDGKLRLHRRQDGNSRVPFSGCSQHRQFPTNLRSGIVSIRLEAWRSIVPSLSTGAKMLVMGFGTWHADPRDVKKAIEIALTCGCRPINCVALYCNENEFGESTK